jgi:D-alanine-D-alanine ligase
MLSNPTKRSSQSIQNLTFASRPVTVVVAYSVVESWERGLEMEMIADAETVETARAIAEGLESKGYNTFLLPVRILRDLSDGLINFPPADTLIFNVCEALGGISGAENQIPDTIAQLGFEVVGGDSDNLTRCLDKVLTKVQLVAAKLPTAPSQLFITGTEPILIDFPLLLKTQFEDCSVGITPNSLVWDEPALRSQVAYLHGTYHQPAFAERFLRGREFYVSLWDNQQGQPEVLAISQADYSSAPDPTLAFDHFEAKWQNTYPSICPAPISSELAATIGQTARAAYQLMGCRDYGRVDMREDGDTVYILEVNPNPALHPDAGFAKAARYAGYSFAEMAVYLVEAAWRRRVNT